MGERDNFITRKVKDVANWTAEVSKKADKFFIALGAGIFVLVSSTIGAAIIIGSAITIIPADKIQRWAKKDRSKAST